MCKKALCSKLPIHRKSGRSKITVMETTQVAIKATKSENSYNSFHHFETEHTATITHNKKSQNQNQMYNTYQTLTIEISTLLVAKIMHK